MVSTACRVSSPNSCLHLGRSLWNCDRITVCIIVTISEFLVGLDAPPGHELLATLNQRCLVKLRRGEGWICGLVTNNVTVKTDLKQKQCRRSLRLFGVSIWLAESAFHVRLRPRIAWLSEEGFEPCFKKEGGKLIPIIVRETPGFIIIRVEPVMREGF